MKVHLTWSGPRSHAVAIAMRDWLPLVLPGATGIVAPDGGDGQARADGAAEAERADCAVICVTPDSTASPRVHFEAGVLWKTLTADRIGCLLVGLRPAELDRSSPLLRFECITFAHDDVLRLVSAIAAAGVLPVTHLDTQFEMWWPQLKDRVGAALADGTADRADSATEKTRLEVMVEELLEIARQQSRRRGTDRRWLEPPTPGPKRAERGAPPAGDATSSRAAAPLLDEDGLPVAKPALPAGAQGAAGSTWMDDWLNDADRTITPPPLGDES